MKRYLAAVIAVLFVLSVYTLELSVLQEKIGPSKILMDGGSSGGAIGSLVITPGSRLILTPVLPDPPKQITARTRGNTRAKTPDLGETTPESQTDNRANARDKWEALAHCESGMGSTSPNIFQFKQSTWESTGHSGQPQDHSYEEQKAAAQLVVARHGFASQFPGCTRKLGLR